MLRRIKQHGPNICDEWLPIARLLRSPPPSLILHSLEISTDTVVNVEWLRPFPLFFTIIVDSDRLSFNQVSTMSSTPSIQLYRSSSFGPTFSFQNALNACDVGILNDTVVTIVTRATLYESGCIVNNTLDCSTACQDANHIFASPYTLQNCIVIVAFGKLSMVSNGSYGIEGDAMAIAREFSIDFNDPDFHIMARKASQIVQGCIGQYCETTPGCHTPGGIFGYGDNNNYSCQDFAYAFDGICDGVVVASLNADIGGIGVR